VTDATPAADDWTPDYGAARAYLHEWALPADEVDDGLDRLRAALR